MAYTRAWNEALPAGSEAANTLDDIIRNLKVDIRERLNDMVKDFTADPIGRMGCQITRTADQVILNNTLTAVAFDAEKFDVGTLHDTAVNNSRITIPAGGNKGIWLFHARAMWATGATGTRKVGIYKNGTGVAVVGDSNDDPPTGTNILTQDIMTLVLAPAVNDYYEMFVLQTNGGNLNLQGVSAGVPLSYFEAVHLI